MTKKLIESRQLPEEFKPKNSGTSTCIESLSSNRSSVPFKDEIKTKQALVTVGGNSSRLKKSGLKISYSKSFLMVEGQPLFYWCLLGLYEAGIEKLVIISDKEKNHAIAKKVLEHFPFRFRDVVFYQDPGLGSNGLPYQARELLDEHFFFECGHSMSSSCHYRKMDSLRKDHNIILSAFVPNRLVSRPYAHFTSKKIVPIEELMGEKNEYEVGSPFLLNQEYANNLPQIDFSLKEAIHLYNKQGRLSLVPSKLPIEFDVLEEMENAMPQYIDFVNQSYRKGI